MDFKVGIENKSRAEKLQLFFKTICTELCGEFKNGHCRIYANNVGDNVGDKSWPDGFDGPFCCIIAPPRNIREGDRFVGNPNIEVSPKSCTFFRVKNSKDVAEEFEMKRQAVLENARLEVAEMDRKKQLKIMENCAIGMQCCFDCKKFDCGDNNHPDKPALDQTQKVNELTDIEKETVNEWIVDKQL
jgi:hypothetical protein